MQKNENGYECNWQKAALAFVVDQTMQAGQLAGAMSPDSSLIPVFSFSFARACRLDSHSECHAEGPAA